MGFWKKYILLSGIVLLITGGIYAFNTQWSVDDSYISRTTSFVEAPQDTIARDTVSHPRFPVAKTVPRYQDLQQIHPIDLKTPDPFKPDFQYNPLTNRYELHSKIGNIDLTTPLTLTPEEYYKYSLQQSMEAFYLDKYSEEFITKDSTKRNSDALSNFNFKFDLGPADRVFGPGGVQLKADGSITTKIGFTRTSTQNPTLSTRQRNRTAFDFDSQIQANITASVGDKLSYGMTYNTQSTMDFDKEKIKLGYVGKEDEIVKTLEAGNVSMNTTNSLIRGGSALFGIKTELQFGKLTVGAIFSQQRSQSQTTASSGNIQTTPFEITADNYDVNMHYLMGYYFFNNYDAAMTTMPFIKSGISIERIEVWVTNKQSNFSEARNIIAFADLGEHSHISNPIFTHPVGTDSLPANSTNDLYSNIVQNYPGARDISQVTQVLGATPLVVVNDYEKIESARKLTQSEYSYNSKLGYISLRIPLQDDDVLGVAYSYRYNGTIYQVGEFSTDNPSNTTGNLYVKLLKGTMVSPLSPTWKLMLKNVYSITNSGQALDRDKFQLNIKYLNDTTGVSVNYITQGAIANQLLLRVMNLDRLNSQNEPHPDGFFDFVDSLTVFPQVGKIIFPEVEPFGSFLRGKFNNDSIANKYVFEELYDSTLTVARQTAEKNKFILQGQYKGGSGQNNITLGGSNIARGSVVVTANGVRLQENTDYIVDYPTGAVTIINPAYANANIQTSYENQSNFGMQRQTMMGLNLNYAISPQFNIGATIMNLSEMPVTMKTPPGEESINNTLFGFNTNYATSSQALTNLLNKIPFLDLTAPSQITLTTEYAQLKPSHYRSKFGGDYSYIDDFEAAKQIINLLPPYPWVLASTPLLFSESRLSNNLDYGKNRSLLAWYAIDPLFTRNSPLTPAHIKNDPDQLSNHYVWEILETELFPNKDLGFNEPATIAALNLAYYPTERGPYNLDADGMNAQGRLNQPEKRWGGMMQRIESGQTDFEANNVETIEFWLLDPFIYNRTSTGGDFYINLGEISEDILKDGKKSFENGLPIDGDLTKVDSTVWGYVAKQQSTVYAFDNTQGARRVQDIGLDGLSNDAEYTFSSYANYLKDLQNKLPQETIQAMRDDPFSPMNDPAGDVYHYFRGSDFDRQKTPILERYKRFNGTEGNSADINSSPESYSTAAKLTPDVEDINQDNTLNETEKYFQYRISIRPQDMQVGQNHIVQRLDVKPLLKNKKDTTVTWYQFKIPIREFNDTYGGIRDFKTIRFVRMFLTNFSDSVILRFGTLELVRGDWRVYTKDLSSPTLPPQGNASISLSVVNVEESGDKEPVNYIMPPGVNRIIDPGQPQLRQQNEQSLAAQITDLSPGDSRAIYKSGALDTRQYRRIQMFSHAEKLITTSNLQDNDLSIFLRLGSDYTNNYYEYEIPVKITPQGRYVDNDASREAVWPQSNMFDFPFTVLTNLKLARNKDKQTPGSNVNFYTPYSSFDPEKPMNKVTVIGNPTISDIKVIMIGVRNNSRNTQSMEIWLDELRLTEFNESGGWAGNANLFVGLSDLGTVNVAGRKETAGFGSLDQGIMGRNLDDKYQYSITTQTDFGRLLPKKVKVSVPFYYSYQKEAINPKYNPLDQDILLKDALDNAQSKAEKDSILNFAQSQTVSKAINFNNIKVNVRSKTPMPYDPANFNFTYSSAEQYTHDATTDYDRTIQTRFIANYAYSNPLKPWHPFSSNSTSGNSNIGSSNSKGVAAGKPQSNAKPNFFRDIEVNYLPKSIMFNSDISRNYNEIQLRDLSDLSNSGESLLPASFRDDFFWNRSLAVQWDLTKNLSMSFNSNTNARIETPYMQVNKQLYPDEYAQWKDSVWQSIKQLGSPLDYKQAFVANYTVPFRNIPALNYLSALLQFSSNYSWQKGATLADSTLELGNMISNNRTIEINNAAINLLSLYNKSKFLEGANKRYTMKRTTNSNANAARLNARQASDTRNQKAAEEKKKKKFEGNIKLSPDSGIVVKHQLDNKRLQITARNANGKLYELSYKTLDNNSILIKNKDSINLKLTISQLPPLEDEFWYKLAQGLARGLMMVRTVGFSYTQSSDMMIPSFRPSIGNFIGQGSSPIGNAPGFDFAFGLVGNDYIDKANQRGWLIQNTNNVTPAIINKMESYKFTSLIEPITGMSITLNADRTTSNQNQIYFMYNNYMQPQMNGNFSMSTISIGSAFEKKNPSNGYYSKAFESFLSNRNVIAGRLGEIYNRTTYPNAGFLTGSDLAGQPFDPSRSAVDMNSADVLIPAFISAYTGGNPNSVGLSAFPSLLKLLPNWYVKYDGFMQLPFINKRFRNFTLEHRYSSIYAVGAYNSFMNWITANGTNDLGFVQNVISNDPAPSSPYNITTVSITEAFSPLIGLNSTLQNNISLSFKYNKTRNISLNISSYQIMEMFKNDFSFGSGYRFDNFNRILKIKKTGGANFNNELKLEAIITYSKMQSLIRQIENNFTQAISGDAQTTLKLSADYSLSKMITLQGFFDKQISNPLISATAYPLTKTDFGLNVRVNFSR